MSKYLVQFSYTDEGLKGLLKEGGTKRREALDQALKSVGAKLESFHFAFGEADGFAIVDGPQEGSLGLLITIGSTGAVKLKTTVLITAEEMDRAVKKDVSYRAPGR
jgi:uncharacterized protein with GYD domain